MTSTAQLEIVDGVRITVPDSLNLITCYVLKEQKDWFEDEIKFLRKLLQPGQKVIDIGANMGVYSLSMARTVGPTGGVWAFEPASSTAALLAQSIAANQFGHVVLDQCALSSKSGTLRLSLNDNSELNELVRDGAPTGASEEVRVSTLDVCRERHGWHGIAFMKIDAEGEERAILNGGQRFFAEQSPLVQYEVKAGTTVHLDLVDHFAALGYHSYRLVPGLGILVPFDRAARVDAFLLNLFACKQDRAAALAEQGFLVQSTPTAMKEKKPGFFAAMRSRFTTRVANDWRTSLVGLPYGRELASSWKLTMAESDSSSEVADALFQYALSRDATLPGSQRFAALSQSVDMFVSLTRRQSRGSRWSSLARAAADLGERALAVEALQRLCNEVFEKKQLDVSEPFLAPSSRFDTIAPRPSVVDWVMASALEELERLAAFSSFYTRDTTLPRVDAICKLGFASDEMHRRAALIRQRFSKTA
jgi:FkbM family methyltransferase